MTTNNLLIVKEFLKDNKSILLRMIIKKIIEKGGLDSVYEYIENYEQMVFKEMSTEDLIFRLKTIDKSMVKMKDIKDSLVFSYRLFTHIGTYEHHKEFFERFKNEQQN